jgi:hypothetical protein
MAEVTILGRGQMVGGRILTDGELPVMTTVAAIGYTGVIKHASGKTSGDMTHGTVFGRRYMICRFPSGRSSIVTRGAVVDDTGVIKHCC